MAMANKTPSIAALEVINKRLSKLERIDVDIEYIKNDLAEIKAAIADVKNGYVTQKEFDPYKKMIMAAILGMIANSLALIYK